VQVRNMDLAMVAKASLRASERPYRDSGSGRMKVRRDALVAVTRHVLKSLDGERRPVHGGAFSRKGKRPHADGLPESYREPWTSFCL